MVVAEDESPVGQPPVASHTEAQSSGIVQPGHHHATAASSDPRTASLGELAVGAQRRHLDDVGLLVGDSEFLGGGDLLLLPPHEELHRHLLVQGLARLFLGADADAQQIIVLSEAIDVLLAPRSLGTDASHMNCSFGIVNS